jgi:dihydrofolate reductase
MPRVRVMSIGVSLDGFAAGPDQSLDHPLGTTGPELMQWFFPTRAFREMQGMEGGETGVDNDMAQRAFAGIGAWILGRNMFGPVRGPWPDLDWRGWWGEEPPYHVPTFVLTHHARPPLAMQGGTTFHFVTDGIRAALEQAKAAAGDADVRIGGGAATIRQYVEAALVDDVHLAMRPVLLGRGETLFQGLDWRARGYRCVEQIAGERATHVIIQKV